MWLLRGIIWFVVFVPLEVESGQTVKLKTLLCHYLNIKYRPDWVPMGGAWEKTGDCKRMEMRAENLLQSWSQSWEVEGGGARQGSRCETAAQAACLHFWANGSVFLTSACFCSVYRCWRVREEHHCEADEVSDCLLFLSSSNHLKHMNGYKDSMKQVFSNTFWVPIGFFLIKPSLL